MEDMPKNLAAVKDNSVLGEIAEQNNVINELEKVISMLFSSLDPMLLPEPDEPSVGGKDGTVTGGYVLDQLRANTSGIRSAIQKLRKIQSRLTV